MRRVHERLRRIALVEGLDVVLLPTLLPAAGLGLAMFTGAEIVNYRFVQISAGGWRAWSRGRIRRPHLAIELRRARGVASLSR